MLPKTTNQRRLLQVGGKFTKVVSVQLHIDLLVAYFPEMILCSGVFWFSHPHLVTESSSELYMGSIQLYREIAELYEAQCTKIKH